MAAGGAALCVTMGDPAGIGPDITLMAALRTDVPGFRVLADPALMQRRAAAMGLSIQVTTETGALSGKGVLAVDALENRADGNPGQPGAGDATATLEALERGAKAVLCGAARALVTAPISKKPLYEAGFGFPGHTEFLEDRARKAGHRDARAVMMLAGPDLRTVPVTVHIALSRVPGALTSDLIVETARITARDLKTRFGIDRPRLALAGLNPHAGEGATMGLEDRDIIGPALARLRGEGIDAFGPLPADTMFFPRARAGYDAALCMYHDQALIPVKTIAFDETVNVTLGLPFVRTSPDHGTAYDIAASGKASPESFLAALRLADLLSGDRA
ncbi:MAG: 4-hydroxythreonine-4-phosphate dehydrogenase PdxA [Hyphomicrobiaceae bacterium]|nr:4-hydroxythreonine-4-phosphate dehydrogenase PdxA [Hyphomicrobiaceae bacterium]